MNPPERSNEWWTELAHAFESHVRSEAFVLEEYDRMRRTVEDPGTAFLLGLIVDDERRHHELFSELAATVRGDGVGPVEPWPHADRIAELREMSARFLDDEREDREHLAKLRRELGGRRGGLWALLIDLMELDTRKHVRILEYLEARLEQLDQR